MFSRRRNRVNTAQWHGMDPRDRKAILGEGGVREENTREIRERTVLERDLEGSPLVGRPLPRRLRNFRPSVDRLVAALGGPLPYMLRLREIEVQKAAHEQALAAQWRELAEECAGDSAAFARRWRRVAGRWNFYSVNDLIDRHNRYYPAEARLPMDPRTRDFVLVNGERYERRPLDAAWVLARFPPQLAAAMQAQRGLQVDDGDRRTAPRAPAQRPG
jgi:hypothetical protein